MDITRIDNDEDLKKVEQRMRALEQSDLTQTEEYERLLTLVDAYKNRQTNSGKPFSRN